MKLQLKKIVTQCLLLIAIALNGAMAQDTVWVRKNAPSIKETYSASFSADGTKIFSGSECSPSYLRIFNTATGDLIWNYELGSTMLCVSGVKMSSDGTKAAAMEEFGYLHIFDYSGSLPLLESTISTGTSGAFALDFSPDGTKIVTGCTDKKMIIYNVADGALLHAADAHGSWVMAVDWSPAGGTIVTCGNDNLIKLWDTTGALIRTIPGHTGFVQTVRFSSDGNYIISGSRDDKIKIWETATGNLIRTISGHTGDIMQVAIADDGTKIVSGSADSTIRVWNFATGAQLMKFNVKNSGKVYTVDFAPNNHYIVAGTANGDVQLWDINLTTGIIQPKAHTHFATIQPNPCRDQINVKSNSKIEEIFITDVTGKVVLSRTINSYDCHIDLSGCADGAYFLRLVDTWGNVQTIKVSKR